ncbi:MAG: NAD(P)/FAD-dependent oxidoreductase [bacterium]|jgi:predicted Rossmann fold flavoprotein
MAGKKRVVVIGGGAAGMMAAGTAGSRGLDVTLVEKNQKVGRKIFITGNGRCNLTNYCDVEELIANVPTNGRFLYSAFSALPPVQLLSLFNELGLETKVERGKRVFPVSERSADVIDVLRRYMRQNKAKVVNGNATKVVTAENRVNKVILADGNIIDCDSVVIATGGMSYPKTGSTGAGYVLAKELGHTITPLRPSLVPLEIKEKWVTQAQGLTLKNIAISVYDQNNRLVYEAFGELFFTHFGVSGPVILSASSRLGDVRQQNYRLIIDLKPALTEEQLDKRLLRDFLQYSRKIFANSLHDLLPKKLIPLIIAQSGIVASKPVNQIAKSERRQLVKLIKNIKLTISDYRPLAEAIVTSGGIKIDEINPSTMESKLVQGLYFAGEVIDVDGYTGGFNLQIAFSTGYLAGLNV